MTWAIAIHGGAGFVSRDADPERIKAYHESLQQALRIGSEELAAGGAALDAVEKTVRFLEDDPLFNAGRGAVFTADAGHELDASIMDGATLDCGAVTGVTTVRHPVTLARFVMENTRHVFFAGTGAERIADEAGVERVEPAWFDTDARRAALQRQQSNAADRSAADLPLGTVGAVALDSAGNLAAATSTGGLTGKAHGRIGDSPVIGAGTYARNGVCAVSGTGVGEQFIRHTVARDIAALMEHRGWRADRAAAEALGRLREGDGGVIVVSAAGRIVMPYNTGSMLRGAADASGRFETHIWEPVSE